MFEVKALTDLPDASKEAVKFIDGITPEMTVPLISKDELVFMSTTSADDTPIGTYKINIGTAVVASTQVIKLTQQVNFRHKNIDRSRLLVCNITPNMRLVELHLESDIHAKYHLSKEVNMAFDGEKMAISFEYVIDGRQQSGVSYEILENKLRDFMTPGHRYILLKLLVFRGSVPENLSFVELDNSNQFVTSSYKDLGKWKVNFDGNWTEVMGIERRLFSANNVEVARYFFDEMGNLLLRVEPGSDLHVVHPSLKNMDSLKHFFVDEQKARVKFDWEKDLEMMSIHDYIKEKVAGDLNKYIYKNAEWKGLMEDLLQQTLMDKPDNIIQFAKQYFTAHK